MTLEKFEEIKPILLQEVEKACLTAIVAMGDDIKGVSWFSATAEEYMPEG